MSVCIPIHEAKEKEIIFVLCLDVDFPFEVINVFKYDAEEIEAARDI